MSTTVVPPSRQIRGKTGIHTIAFLIACIILILRRPDVVFHARFYAEDGAIFYASAYNYGWWKVLFSPYQGYLHFLPRVAAGLALLVPLKFAPLVMNLIAVCLEALPVSLLLKSERWGSLRLRIAMAAIYLLLPNCSEILGSVTESQWILALCASLILIEGTRHLWLIVLCALTGPFCVPLFPFALCFRRKAAAMVLGAGSILQTAVYLMSPHPHRYTGSLGAGLIPLLRILGAQVYAGTLLGGNDLALIAPTLTISIALIGTALIVCVKETRWLQLFAAGVLALSLLNPVCYPPHGYTAWQSLASAPDCRYWFFPCLAVGWSLAYAAQRPRLRFVAIPLLVLMLFGIARDFRRKPNNNVAFTEHAQQFVQAKPGTTVEIPVYPRGWKIVLIKH